VFLSFLAALGTVLGMCWIYDHLHLVGYLGQPEALIPIARPYLHYYAAAFVFMLCTGNLRAYCESQNRPWLPMYIVLGAIAANAVLDFGLVYGIMGFPKMGLPGAGLATLICSAGQFFALLWLILRHRELHLTLRELLRPAITRAHTIRHLRIGIPTALQIGLEIASMSVVAIMAGRLGATTLAAHHITVQIAAFSFMVPLGMSFAVSIRVSQTAGAGDRGRMRSVAEGAMLFAFCWMLAVSACILLARHALPAIFTHDADVIAMASTFLIAAAGFQVFDGLQCTAMGALRGMKDVNIPTLIVILAYWAFEIPLAWVLCFVVGTGGMGIWISMFLALVLSATFLSVRLRRVLAAG
jgi:MATE family multidrug resistance protein